VAMTKLLSVGDLQQKNQEDLVTPMYAFGEAGMPLIWSLVVDAVDE